jgi:acyl-homoserine-lactone acylase
MAGRVFGKDAAAIDYFVHLLGTREIAADKFETVFSPQFKAMMQAYADAFNDFALAHPERVLFPKAFPVSTLDITSAYILSLAQMSGADQAIKKIVEGTITEPEPEVVTEGSNAIAIHPSRTTSGEAFLAINSHQPLEGPVSWYEVHISTEEGWNILGGLFPGGLTVFHGANEHLGWAHTVNRPDKLDVYKLDWDGDTYLVDGEQLKLKENLVWLKVKLWDLITIPIPRKVYRSIYGPTMVTDQGAFSIRTGVLEEIRAPEQWYKMNKARNFSEFYEAMSLMALPGFNTIYADRYDTIFYVSNALLPKRPEGFDFSGVVQGDSRKVLWEDYFAFRDLPQQVNPSSGYLYNTNHSPFKASAPENNLDPEAYPNSMKYILKDNNRSLRFRELMPDSGLLSYESFRAIKFDKQLPKKLAYSVNLDALFELDTLKYPDIARAIQTLQNWDRKAGVDSKGAALFAHIYYYWRDKGLYSGVLTEDQAVEGIREATQYFSTHFGNDLVELGTLQKLKRGEKELPVWGLEDVLAAMRSENAGGTVRKAEQGESYILMVRYSKDGPLLESVNVYGASNQPSSPHYDDQMKLFLNQELKPMSLDKAGVLKNATRIYSPGTR